MFIYAILILLSATTLTVENTLRAQLGREMFDAMDSDRNGEISKSEAENYFLVYLSYLSAFLSICPSVSLPVTLYVCLSARLSVSVAVCFRHSVFRYARHLSLSLYTSVRQSFYISVYVLCLSVYVF